AKAITDRRSDAVALRGRGSRQNVRVSLDVADAMEGAQLGQLAFVQQLVQPLGPAPGAPQVLFVLASDEPSYVEPESQVVPSMVAQGAEGDAKHGGPTGRVPRDNHVPDAVPVRVEIVDSDELGIPHRAVRIGAEDESP